MQGSEEQIQIISVLESVSEKAETQGHITVGDITASHNALTGKNDSAKHIGSLLRTMGLVPKQDSHRGTYEISYQELQQFLKTISSKSAHPQEFENIDNIIADIEMKSPQTSPEDASTPLTWRTLEAQGSPENTSYVTCDANIADIADVVSAKPEKLELFKIKKSGMEIVE